MYGLVIKGVVYGNIPSPLNKTLRTTVNPRYNESEYNEFLHDSLTNRLPPLFCMQNNEILRTTNSLDFHQVSL